MPTITVIKKDLERLADQAYSLDELSTALETAKAEIDEAGGERLRIQLKDTNRPDLWSSEGLARFLKGFRTEQHPVYGFYDEDHGDRTLVVDPGLERIRPYIAAFACDGVQIDEDALEQLIECQERLCENYGRGRSAVAIGIYDASDIVYPVRYEAADPDEARFVPLESPLGPDRPLSLGAILSEHPTGKTYAHLLEGFDRYPLISDSRGEVLSMPPIINSHTLGRVEVGDTCLFCEATGTELDAVLLSTTIMAVNLADRGGRIRPVLVEYPYDTPRGRQVRSPLDLTERMHVEFDDISRAAGGGLDPDRILRAMNAMGYRDIELNVSSVRARPAVYRDDLLHPVDLIEDVVISEGYDNFEPEMPHDFTVGKSAPEEDLSDRLRATMVGSGFQEAFLPILCSAEDLTGRMRTPDARVAEIANPMSVNYSAARSALLPGLLRMEGVSRRAIYPHRVFEVGEVVVLAPEENYGTRTEIRLAALEAHTEANLSDLQSHLEAIAYYFRADYTLNPVDHPTYLPGRAGEICVDGVAYGVIGELHPEVLENWGVSVPASAFEVNIQMVE